MGFDNFRVNIVIRILILLGNIFILTWGLLNTQWQVTPFVCLVILLLQVAELIHFVERTNRQFTNFLHAISEHDFSTHFTAKGKGESFETLAGAYNQITAEFTRLNSERAAKHQLLEALVEHVSIALLCIDEDSNIILMNQAAKKLFSFPYIHTTYSLGKVDPQLPLLLGKASAGENQLIKLQLEGEQVPLSMFTTRFLLLDDTYTLASFQNIRDELEIRELDSWQKLIQVLTHEIMNSVTPIVSLAEVIKQMLMNQEGEINPAQLSKSETQDLLRSLIAIESRGKGLIHFVESYKNLANPPAPVFSSITVSSLFQRVTSLMLPQLETTDIALQTSCVPSSLVFNADQQQIEQVLINLIKNATEAMAGQSDGRIHLNALKHPSRGIQISVRDNGPGIPAELQQDIFIPFYSSKKNGTGIGLSISRQILLANKGLISVNSQEGKGSEFILTFRNAT